MMNLKNKSNNFSSYTCVFQIIIDINFYQMLSNPYVFIFAQKPMLL